VPEAANRAGRGRRQDERNLKVSRRHPPNQPRIASKDSRCR